MNHAKNVHTWEFGQFLEFLSATTRGVEVFPTSHKVYQKNPSQGKQQFAENLAQEEEFFLLEVELLQQVGNAWSTKGGWSIVSWTMDVVWHQLHTFC